MVENLVRENKSDQMATLCGSLDEPDPPVAGFTEQAFELSGVTHRRRFSIQSIPLTDFGFRPKLLFCEGRDQVAADLIAVDRAKYT